MGREQEPTRRELRAIEAEWPVIAAELAVVDAECLAARIAVEPSELERRRVRRARAAQLRVIRSEAGHGGLGGAA